MRLWSLHPKYLDSKGLVALWQERLLAQKVLQGKTKGYRYHPQLIRFQTQPNPIASIGRYLWEIWREAKRRGYTFNLRKLKKMGKVKRLTVTRGQCRYEWEHLRRKLCKRDPTRFKSIQKNHIPEPHPLFRLIPGGMESWEKSGPSAKG